MERMRESTRNGGGKAAGKTPGNNTMAPASHGNTQGNTMAPSSRESSKPTAPAPDGTKLGTAPTATADSGTSTTPAPGAWARLREALTKPRGAEARAIERQANPPSAIELANNPNPNAAVLPSDPGDSGTPGNSASPGRFTRWWRRHRPSDRALGWIAPLIVSLLGGFVRFFRLGSPRFLVFDETYYVKAAWTMLQTGEAREWPKFGVELTGIPTRDTQMDRMFAMGQADLYTSQPLDIFTHPPLGKWLIAAGMKLFGGATPFAWRFTAALAGTLAILLMARVALRLFHNVSIATTAAMLMAFDGQAITLSRTAILDIFLMVLVLGAFLCLLNHRDWALRRLRAAHERDVARPGTVVRSEPLADRERRGEGGDTYAPAGRPSVRLVVDSTGPVTAFSWWRLTAFVLLGLATGVKWSGGYFFAVFAVLSVFWDGYNRRIVGYRGWFGSTIAKDGLLTALYAIPAYALAYLACWTSWFMTPDARMRHWAEENPGQGVTWLPDALRSLVHLHETDMQTARGISGYNPTGSKMYMWPLQLASTTFRVTYVKPSADGSLPAACNTGGGQCIATIMDVGNLAVWWVGAACLVMAIVWAVRRRGDWRAIAAWSGMIAGWLPWAAYLDRTTYSFYSVTFLPWVILGACYGLDWVRRRSTARSFRRRTVALDVAVVAIALFMYPVWTDVPLPMDRWMLRMPINTWLRGV